jgi:NAD(P)-dependent dehydrogenase (short-subunit alcohol dehydrogenase family)
VLITGANSGIGLCTAVHLAGRGWPVWGTVRTRAKAAVLRQAAREAGVAEQVRAVVLDVSDHEAVLARWPRMPAFHAVVNNAGASLTAAVETATPVQARAVLDINLVTPAVVASCALPAMRRRGFGRIVMVSSMAGCAALLPFHGWYHASKFGLEALSDVLRVEVAPFGVKVAVVQPGFFGTAMLSKAEQQMNDSERHGDAYASPLARMQRLLALVEQLAPPPDAVARAITSAIESRRPKRRYVVGRDAVAYRAMALAPDEITDRVVSLVSNLGAASRGG